MTYRGHNKSVILLALEIADTIMEELLHNPYVDEEQLKYVIKPTMKRILPLVKRYLKENKDGSTNR